jgi:hypothetical protein
MLGKVLYYCWQIPRTIDMDRLMVHLAIMRQQDWLLSSVDVVLASLAPAEINMFDQVDPLEWLLLTVPSSNAKTEHSFSDWRPIFRFFATLWAKTAWITLYFRSYIQAGWTRWISDGVLETAVTTQCRSLEKVSTPSLRWILDTLQRNLLTRATVVW